MNHIIPPIGNELLSKSMVLVEHCLFSCKKDKFTWTSWGKSISEERKCIWASQELKSRQERSSPNALFLLCAYLLYSSLILYINSFPLFLCSQEMTLYSKTSFYNQLPSILSHIFESQIAPLKSIICTRALALHICFFCSQGLRESSESGKWAVSLRWNVPPKGKNSLFSKGS